MTDETQTYAVGLPVVITVGETGVEYSVDFGDVRRRSVRTIPCMTLRWMSPGLTVMRISLRRG